MRNNIFGSLLFDNVINRGHKFQSMKQALGGSLTITTNFPHLLFLDPGGADRSVILPAEADGEDRFWIIVNTADADEQLNVYEDSSTTLQAVIDPGATCWIFGNGSAWYTFYEGGAGGLVQVPDAATYTVLAANSGKMHAIPDLTADCAITLPVVDNVEFEFMYTGAAPDAQDWNFDTGSDTNFFKGGVIYMNDTPAGDAVYSDGDSNSKFNVLVPEVGTRVKMWCDGVNYFLTGFVSAESAPTFADQ